jgi:hypothetical protein
MASARESVWVVETWDEDDKKWYPMYLAGFNLAANAHHARKRYTLNYRQFKFRVVRYEATK